MCARSTALGFDAAVCCQNKGKDYKTTWVVSYGKVDLIYSEVIPTKGI